MEIISGSALTKFCSRFKESLYSEESLSITTFFFFLRYDPAGAHIKKDLLKQHIPYKNTVFIGQTALAAC